MSEVVGTIIWAEVFPPFEGVVDRLVRNRGIATERAIVKALLPVLDVPRGFSHTDVVDQFNSFYKLDHPLLRRFREKYELVYRRGEWAYVSKQPKLALEEKKPKNNKAKSSPQPKPPLALSVGSLLTDTAILTAEQDRLNFQGTAETLATFIAADKTATPLVLAVNAPWGTGKSSLVNMVLRELEKRTFLEDRLYVIGRSPRLRKLVEWCKKKQKGSLLHGFAMSVERARPRLERRKHTVMRFDAWMHDDAPQIVSAFAVKIIISAGAARHYVQQVIRPVPWRYATPIAKLGMLIWLVAIGFALWMLYTYLLAAKIIPANWLELLTKTTAKPATTTTPSETAAKVAPPAIAALGLAVKYLKDGLGSVQKFLKNPEKAAADATLIRVNERLRSLFRQATSGNRKFIIYIDNLERCKPENTLALLETVNQLLSHHGVVVILAADMEMVAAAAGSRFKEQAKILAKGEGNEAAISLDFGRRYVRKMVQLCVPVPRARKVDLPKLAQEVME